MLLLSVETDAAAVTPGKAVVLVAEDEVFVRNVVCLILQREGHLVLAASNGMEALEVARKYKGKIDLLVSDVQMPEMDGLSLVDLIRPERPELRILLMSGKMPGEVPEDKKDIPILRKPFRSNEFLSKVRAALE